MGVLLTAMHEMPPATPIASETSSFHRAHLSWSHYHRPLIQLVTLPANYASPAPECGTRQSKFPKRMDTGLAWLHDLVETGWCDGLMAQL